MKNPLYILLFLLASHLSAQQLSIDETKASVTFTFLEDKVDGTLEGFDFTGSINGQDLINSSISGTVDMKTLDTNNWLRNRHLRAKKYFNLKEHPKLKFTSSKIEKRDATLTVTGLLEIKGISKKVSFSFEKTNDMLIGTAQINSQDFDISIHDKWSENKVLVRIKLPFTQ